MNQDRTRTRAYFHYLNKTGWNPDDALSNWAQAEREERRLARSPLSCDSYTLRFPFWLPPTYSISDLEEPHNIPSGSANVTLTSTDSGYLLTASLASETSAKAFFLQALSALAWLALDLKLPVTRPRTLGRVTWSDDPYQAALNISRSFNLPVRAPLDGLAATDEALIHPEWAVLRFEGMGKPSVHLTTSCEDITNSLATGLASTNPEVFTADPRLEIALELFLSHFHEHSEHARLLTLVMSLETLTTGDVKHQAAVDLLDRWRNELAVERCKHAKDSEEAAALDALDNELWFRKEASIGSQVRSVVRRALTAVGATDVKLVLQRTVNIYKARSRLAHNGTLPSPELAQAITDARDIITRVLKARLLTK